MRKPHRWVWGKSVDLARGHNGNVVWVTRWYLFNCRFAWTVRPVKYPEEADYNLTPVDIADLLP